jgi:hypothetical protein
MSDSQLMMEIRSRRGHSYVEADSNLGISLPEGVLTVSLHFTEEGEAKLVNLRIPITRIERLFRVFFGSTDSSMRGLSCPWAGTNPGSAVFLRLN